MTASLLLLRVYRLAVCERERIGVRRADLLVEIVAGEGVGIVLGGALRLRSRASAGIIAGQFLS